MSLSINRKIFDRVKMAVAGVRRKSTTWPMLALGLRLRPRQPRMAKLGLSGQTCFLKAYASPRCWTALIACAEALLPLVEESYFGAGLPG